MTYPTQNSHSSFHKISFQWSYNCISYTLTQAGGNESFTDFIVMYGNTEARINGAERDSSWSKIAVKIYTLYVQYAV